jgi:hypothetical protein
VTLTLEDDTQLSGDIASCLLAPDKREHLYFPALVERY